ncbi:MAG: FAD-binding oxidoreductase, partial [Chromatiales bacterium]|nr:FAD-binding oxidoreductase [Chromatiales bacterium]
MITALGQILPAEAVLIEEEETRPYECDGLSAYRQLPMVVVLPANAEQVQQIMRIC